ncbi:hypothetical protein BGZ76_004676 [Entomortierella beljakovae]|nr:hypothetical protein BGZ76_004676 [Entomortierella beljakovae]
MNNTAGPTTVPINISASCTTNQHYSHLPSPNLWRAQLPTSQHKFSAGLPWKGLWHSPKATVGGQLQLFQKAWELITDNTWAHSIIGEGFQIPFLSTPPTTGSQGTPSQMLKEEEETIEAEVIALLEKQAIKEASGPVSKLIVHNSQEDRKLTPSPQPMTTQQVREAPVIQDGDHPNGMFHAPEEQPLNICGSERCVSTCSCITNLLKVSSVSLKVETVSIQDTTIWPLSVTTSVHKSALPTTAMGKEKGHMNSSISQQPDCNGKLKGKVTVSDTPSSDEAERIRVSNHLGFMINTKEMTLSVPKSKLHDLRQEATKINNKGFTTLKNLMLFIGKAIGTTAAVFPA